MPSEINFIFILLLIATYLFAMLTHESFNAWQVLQTNANKQEKLRISNRALVFFAVSWHRIQILHKSQFE